MRTSDDWPAAATALVRRELDVAGMTFEQLARELTRAGIAETEASIKNKLYRGTFSAVFLLQCLAVLKRQTLDLRGILPSIRPD